MSKRLPNETSRPPVRLRLPQISSQELKTIRVAIRRKDLPQDAVHTGPLIRSLDDPEGLILHKPGEGEKPIFDREDIIVNLDFEERIVVATDTLRSSKSEERQKSNSRSRRSGSRSRHKSLNRDYYSRSRSRSNDRIPRSSACTKEDSRKSSTSFHRTVGEHSKRTEKSDAYDSDAETSSGAKNRRRSSSKERQRSSSRDREHSKFYRRKSPKSESYRSRHYESERRRRTPSPGSKYDYRHRKYSRSPTYKRETSYRSHAHYSKSQERRSRSPYRDRDPKYKDYRKRSRSPYSRDRYKSPGRKEHREYSRSPPKYRGPPDDQRRPLPPYQIPPNFGPPWPVYEPVPPYLRFVVPDGYMPAPPPRIPGNLLVRPRMPPRQLPIYNNRPIPKVKDCDSNASTSTASIPTSSSTPSASTATATTTTNVTEDITAKPDNDQSTDVKDSKDKGDSATTDKSVD